MPLAQPGFPSVSYTPRTPAAGPACEATEAPGLPSWFSAAGGCNVANEHVRPVLTEHSDFASKGNTANVGGPSAVTQAKPSALVPGTITPSTGPVSASMMPSPTDLPPLTRVNVLPPS